MRRALLLLLVGLVLASFWVWRALEPPSPLLPTADAFALSQVTVINPMRERISNATLRVRDGVIDRLSFEAGAPPPDALERYGGG